MSYFLNPKTTRYRAHVVPADAREGDYSRQTIYNLEAVDYWEAKRTLDVLFGSQWQHLSEARLVGGRLVRKRWFGKSEHGG